MSCHVMVVNLQSMHHTIPHSSLAHPTPSHYPFCSVRFDSDSTQNLNGKQGQVSRPHSTAQYVRHSAVLTPIWVSLFLSSISPHLDLKQSATPTRLSKSLQ